MATISIRIKDQTLEEINKSAGFLHIPKAEYIRQAIMELNKKVAKELRRQRMLKASKMVREESMRVNAEFAEIEDCPSE